MARGLHLTKNKPEIVGDKRIYFYTDTGKVRGWNIALKYTLEKGKNEIPEIIAISFMAIGWKEVDEK